LKKISVIIPHYNGFDTLNNCISSLYNSLYNKLEIIVVNNNSSDDSIEKISDLFNNIIIINSSKNLGYAGGCNLGSKHSTCEYLLFLNNDTEHDYNWIEPLYNFIKDEDNVASVQPKIKSLIDKEQFDYAGACGGYMDILCYPFTRGRIFNNIEIDSNQYNERAQIFWASGTGFLTKKTILNTVGGFDSNLFAHMEEIDYHWKCQLLGYQVWCEPKSVIYHSGGQTLSYESPYKTYLNHRNSLILLLSNYSVLFSALLFLPRIFLEIISIIKYLVSLKPSHAFSQILALLYVVLRIDILIKRKNHINKIRKISDQILLKNIYKRSIVIDYFILGKNVFSKINL